MLVVSANHKTPPPSRSSSNQVTLKGCTAKPNTKTPNFWASEASKLTHFGAVRPNHSPQRHCTMSANGYSPSLSSTKQIAPRWDDRDQPHRCAPPDLKAVCDACTSWGAGGHSWSLRYYYQITWYEIYPVKHSRVRWVRPS
jgi:hypothetical protein